MADARKDKRTLLSLKIRYKSATLEDFIERYSSDISRGGVFIKAKKPLAVGTLLKFEFILQDQSTLIHGVGRVVWRRDEAETDAENPSGMGIKFIKMDPESRSVVQRIAEDRGQPGVFDHGKEGVRHAPDFASDPGDLAEADRTKVRHVSEFLASALEEGGAGDVAKREAQAGAERARQISNQIGGNQTAAARGAFSTYREVPSDNTETVADAPSRGAMSAFGGSGLSGSGRMSSAAAPAMDELDAEDDFLDDETTKVHELAESDFPADADATVVARDASSAFIAEKLLTPVVPAASSSPLQDAVPDLFGPGSADSFGPAEGEFIDASLLDPGVPTVPPLVASVPEAPGIPAEAFQVPKASTPAWTMRPTPEKKDVRGWLFLILFVVVVAAGAGAAWQLGYTDDLMKLAAPYLGQSTQRAEEPSRAVQPEVVPAPQPEEVSAEAQPAQEVIATEAAAPTQPKAEAEAAPVEATPVEAADTGVVNFRVLSRPSGAFVSVNGKGIGRTPLELEYEVG
ncbi:MAG: TIGR02266 family protein, partial [Deltaproteobacteria bacterium]|nr:TIGR02266 family protein [Deltaproteobacteria bacterium]